MSYQLITCLFDFLEIRGVDAAGLWGTETGDGKVFYHKEPIRSSQFVQKEFWKSLADVNTNLLITHARATSAENGHARTNANNHPFVSSDKRIGLVHNGTLSEFQYLKNKYDILSNTDSEVLLRMFEDTVGPDNYSIEDQVKGIENIWSVIDHGAMAVGIGERIDADTRYLFLFRNRKRPLWIADLRDLLGQIFFFSSPDVWYRAVSSSATLQEKIAGIPNLIEVPDHQIWCFWLDCDHPMMLETKQVEKYDIIINDSENRWEAGEKVNIQGPKTELSVVCPLDENEEVVCRLDRYEDYEEDEYEDILWSIEDQDSSLSCPKNYEEDDDYEAFSVIDPPINKTVHEDFLLQIESHATDIDVKADELLRLGTLSASEYQELTEALEQTSKDMERTLRLLGG